jgi:RHS repeat-associated protein
VTSHLKGWVILTRKLVGDFARKLTNYYLVDDHNPSGYAQVLEEWTSTGTPTLSKVYNYGLSLVSQQQGSTTYYFISDGHGSTRLLIDAAGAVQNVFAYDAFGTLIASNAAPLTVYLYCGQQFDSNLGLYYNRARYLNPGTGRFWTMDTYAGNNEDPLSLHKYLYGGDDPIDNTDPSGHDIGDLMLAMDISAGLDALPGISITPMGLASSLPQKILPVHAYSLQSPNSLRQFDFGQASEAVGEANAILAQASIKMQLSPSDFHLWDMDKTRQRAGDTMRVYRSIRGAPGKNWGTITEDQDPKVANVYFSAAFQNEQGQVTPDVLGMTAAEGNSCYPAVFIADPWGSVVAHEIGHLLNLTDVYRVDSENNLMYWVQDMPKPNAVLTQDQIMQMRTSRLLR